VSLFERVGDLEKTVQGNASANANVNANVNASENANGEVLAGKGRARSGRIRAAHNRQHSGD